MLLSIVIPCYNSEKYITNTLEAIFSQDMSDIEVIVVNDGSTDSTNEIIENYRNRIKIINKENEGVSIARNIGVQNAIGKYIYFLDSDDFISADLLDFLKNTLSSIEADIDIFAFGYQRLRNNQIEKKYIYKKYDGCIFNSDELLKLYFLKRISFHICSCVFRREFLQDKNIIFPKGIKIGEDVDFLMLAFKNMNKLQYSKKNCYSYILRDNTAMQGYNKFNEYRYSLFRCRKERIYSEYDNDKELSLYASFFIKVLYCNHLIMYLKSKNKNVEFSRFLVEDYECLWKKSVYGRYPYNMIVFILKKLPIKLMLKGSK